MPKILEFLGFDFWFYSNENSGNSLEPVHIHVGKNVGGSSTKFWITEKGIKLENNNAKLSNKQLKDIGEYIENNQDLIVSRWLRHFGSAELMKI